MAFDDLERSREDGRPVFLYRFTLGSTVWRYTSADQSILTSDGFLWTAVPISDDGVKQTGESTTDALMIRAPFGIGPVQAHLGTPPSQSILVAILHKHEDNVQVVVVYAGEISQVDFPRPGEATITCETLSASMQREGLRYGWQPNCPHTVYDVLSCKAPKVTFGVETTVLSITGAIATVEGLVSFAANRFAGGFMEWLHPIRGLEFRAIESSSGNDLLMFGQVGGIYPGLVVIVYPGCNHTSTVCEDVFDNLLNFGGCEFMPGKSPFDGDPVF